jgi:hypothetical protein
MALTTWLDERPGVVPIATLGVSVAEAGRRRGSATQGGAWRCRGWLAVPVLYGRSQIGGVPPRSWRARARKAQPENVTIKAPKAPLR